MAAVQADIREADAVAVNRLSGPRDTLSVRTYSCCND
jgi:hypothetical protein